MPNDFKRICRQQEDCNEAGRLGAGSDSVGCNEVHFIINPCNAMFSNNLVLFVRLQEQRLMQGIKQS